METTYDQGSPVASANRVADKSLRSRDLVTSVLYCLGMPSILVIEDEPDLREVLEFNLRQAGHEVLLAGRASEGLKTAKQRLPDLVILDLMLPDRPGTEVCRDL